MQRSPSSSLLSASKVWLPSEVEPSRRSRLTGQSGRSWKVGLPCLLVLSLACATGGGGSAEPPTWPTGQFLLEGSVSYDSGLGNRREAYVAHLLIGPAGAMVLDSETGVCREPTPPELERDRRRGRRTFRCGDVTFEVRPASDTVVGDLEAEVMEDREVRECVQYSVNSDGQRVCMRYRTRVESVRVTKEGTLRVSREGL